MADARATLGRRERIKSRKQVEALFEGGNSRSMAAFPLRVVYMLTEATAEEPPVQMMVSVSKRHFKHAVQRNRVKRQVREAYRLNKQPLHDHIVSKQPGKALWLAFIWQADKLFATNDVTTNMQRLLQRLIEQL
ncbi:MAG: ribonuclease P protein component [Prevotella sp.]|nr:ribonuclease P protein component [Prevotella sp.]